MAPQSKQVEPDWLSFSRYHKIEASIVDKCIRLLASSYDGTGGTVPAYNEFKMTLLETHHIMIVDVHTSISISDGRMLAPSRTLESSAV